MFEYLLKLTTFFTASNCFVVFKKNYRLKTTKHYLDIKCISTFDVVSLPMKLYVDYIKNKFFFYLLTE